MVSPVMIKRMQEGITRAEDTASGMASLLGTAASEVERPVSRSVQFGSILGLHGGSSGANLESEILAYLNELAQNGWRSLTNFGDALARHIFGEEFTVMVSGDPGDGTTVTAAAGDEVTDENRFLVIHGGSYVYRDPITEAVDSGGSALPDNTRARTAADFVQSLVEDISDFLLSASERWGRGSGAADSLQRAMFGERADGTIAYAGGSFADDEVLPYSLTAEQRGALTASNTDALTFYEWLDRLGLGGLSDWLSDTTEAVFDWFRDDTGPLGGLYHGLYNDDDDSAGNDQSSTTTGNSHYALAYRVGEWIRTTGIDLLTAGQNLFNLGYDRDEDDGTYDTGSDWEWGNVLSNILAEATDATADLWEYIEDSVSATVAGVQDWFQDDPGVLGAFYEGLTQDFTDSDGNAQIETGDNRAARYRGTINAAAYSVGEWMRTTGINLLRAGEAIFRLGYPYNIATSTYGTTGWSYRNILPNVLREASDAAGAIWTQVRNWLRDDTGILGGFYHGITADNLSSTGGTQSSTTTNDSHYALAYRVGNWIRGTGINLLKAGERIFNLGYARSSTGVYSTSGGWLWGRVLPNIIAETTNAVSVIGGVAIDWFRNDTGPLGGFYHGITGDDDDSGGNDQDSTTDGNTLYALSWRVGDWIRSVGINLLKAGQNIFNLGYPRTSGGSYTTTGTWSYANILPNILKEATNAATTLAAYITGTGGGGSFLADIKLFWDSLTGQRLAYGDDSSDTDAERLEDVAEFLRGYVPYRNQYGDFVFSTQDLVGVDRIFFESNDGVDHDSAHSHITAYGASESTRGMDFRIRESGAFRWYRRSSSTANSSTQLLALTASGDLGVSRHIVAGLDIRGRDVDASGDISGDTILVTQAPGTTNGTIGESGGDVIIRSGGSSVNITDLAEASGGGGAAEPLLNSRLRVYLTNIYNNPTASLLDTWFGAASGTLGIAAATVASSTSQAYLWLHGSNYWHGKDADRRVSATNDQTTLNQQGGEYVAHRRVRFYTSSADHPTSSETLSRIGVIPGRPWIWQESDDDDDISFGISDPLPGDTDNWSRIDAGGTNSNRLVADTTTGTSITNLIDEMPVINISGTLLTHAALDVAFGIENGRTGYNRGTREFLAKVNGYWFAWTMRST